MTFERWTTAASIEIEAAHNGAALVHVVSALKALAAERAEARRAPIVQEHLAALNEAMAAGKLRVRPPVRYEIEPRSISHWGMFA